MKILETNFTQLGFSFKQIAREGDFALYERSKGEVTHWEVIKISSHNGYKIAGVTVPPGESYPNSESWGTKGWSFNDKEQAWDKFRELVK